MTECEWTIRLSAYHDGELPEADVMAVEQHVSQCPACQRDLRQYRKLSVLIGREEIPELAGATLEKMKDAIEWEGNPVILRLARRMTGIAAAVVIGGALWLMTGNSLASNTPTPLHDWEAAAVSPVADATQPNTGDAQLAEWIVTDLSRK